MKLSMSLCTILLASWIVQSSGDCPIEKPPVVAFTAVLRKMIKGYNQIIKYDKVLTNVGNGYDSTSGIFSVKESGIYNIAVSMLTAPTMSSHLLLIKNGKELIRLYSGKSDYEAASTTINLNLKKGDRVWIKQHSGNYLHPANYNIFSAALISAGNF